MKICIDEILKEQEKTRYWLAKQVDVAYQNMANICNGNTTSIRFELIEKICIALCCTPNDIFRMEDDIK